MSIVYFIRDDAGAVRYVGKTGYSVKIRESAHRALSRCPKSDLHHWLASNITTFQAVETDLGEMALEREAYWIWRLRFEGASLFNVFPKVILPKTRAALEAAGFHIPGAASHAKSGEPFDKIADRALALRLTVPELIAIVPGMSGIRYWRARTGRLGKNAQARVLRQVESELDRIERERIEA